MWRQMTQAMVLAVGALAASSAVAQQWPSQTVTLMVPFPAGGGVDNLARILAEKLSNEWDQSVVVMNRPGGSTIVGTNAAINATDDHTLLLTTDATFTVVPRVNPNASHKLGHDLEPVALVAEFNQMLVANAEYAPDSLPQILSAGKDGKEFTYASYGVGSEPQLAIEMLKHLTGLEIRHIPYKGVPQALNGVVAGEVDFTTSGTKTIEPLVRGGKLVPIAFTGPERDDLFPNIRTFAEHGLEGVTANVSVGIFVPTSLPESARETIRHGVNEALQNDDFHQRAIVDRGFVRPTFVGDDLMQFFSERDAERAQVVEIAQIGQE